MGIDPKIRARRIAVKRAEGRRRLRLLVAGLAVATLVGAAWLATRSPLFDVDHFEINGISTRSAGEVIDAAAVPLGTPLLDVDLGSVDSRVEELSWVKSARSARQWPGTLRVDLVERVPVALIPSGEGVYGMLDESGVVMSEVTLGSAPDLLVIDVDFSTQLGSIEEAALPGLEVVAAMPADLSLWVQHVIVGPGSGEVGLDLRGRADVVLGDTTALEDKLLSLRSVLAGTDLACISEIDVSVADLPTIRRDSVCEGETPVEGGGQQGS